MKILADESVDNDIVFRLRDDGHAVEYVAEMSPGIMDEEVLLLARDYNTLLVTADKDFGELIFRQGYVKRGIVLYRLAGISSGEKADIVSKKVSENLCHCHFDERSEEKSAPRQAKDFSLSLEMTDRKKTAGLFISFQTLSKVIAEHGKELLQAFSVITDKAVRIRKN